MTVRISDNHPVRSPQEGDDYSPWHTIYWLHSKFALVPAREKWEARIIYEIRVDGYLDNRWKDWFYGMTLTYAPDGTTTLSGKLPDQSALHGVLAKIIELGVRLISVQQVDQV